MGKTKLFMLKNFLSILIVSFLLLCAIACASNKKASNKPYDYGRVPANYMDIVDDYENYHVYLGCNPGETIASIGSGNGIKEVQVSCFVDRINWYLEEIDSTRLYQFKNVLEYHESLIGIPINATFQLILGEENSTMLPEGIFDRVLMINVFHEIENRKSIMMEIQKLLKPGGELVIMERMGDEAGQTHKDCKHPMLYEPELETEMLGYGYQISKVVLGEEMSRLTFYTFKSL